MSNFVLKFFTYEYNISQAWKATSVQHATSNLQRNLHQPFFNSCICAGLQVLLEYKEIDCKFEKCK